MKKINYIFISLAILFISGCAKDEADIFSASPADRLNQALKEDFAVLTSAQNGWAMEYFATLESPGYTLLVKFDVAGKATIAAKSELTQDEEFEMDTCLFEMIGDNGPVLTFNTYNKVLHRFSTPENPDGYGLEGDYEFVVISASSEQMVLKGKKRGVLILLNKLPNEVAWNQYLTDLETLDSLLFSEDAPKLIMKIGNSSYSFTNGMSHVFSILKEGAGANLPVVAPFIVTTTGIRFQAVQEIEGVKFQTLKFTDDKNALVSIENPDLKLIGTEDLARYFFSNIKVWEFIPTELSPNLKAIYDQIVQSCVAKYNARDVKLAIKYYPTRSSFEMTLTFLAGEINKEGNLDLTLNTPGKNELSILYKGTGDTEGNSYYTDIAGFKEMSAVVSSNFLLSTGSMINPQKIKFTQKTNASSWFTVAGL